MPSAHVPAHAHAPTPMRPMRANTHAPTPMRRRPCAALNPPQQPAPSAHALPCITTPPKGMHPASSSAPRSSASYSPRQVSEKRGLVRGPALLVARRGGIASAEHTKGSSYARSPCPTDGLAPLSRASRAASIARSAVAAFPSRGAAAGTARAAGAARAAISGPAEHGPAHSGGARRAPGRGRPARRHRRARAVSSEGREPQNLSNLLVHFRYLPVLDDGDGHAPGGLSCRNNCG